MTDERDDSSHSADATLDHMLDEMKELEGVGAKGRWIKWAVLLVALAVVVGGVYFTQRLAPKRAAVKGEGIRIELEAPPQGKLAAAPTEFRWQSVAGRHHYVLRVGTTADGSEIFQETVRSNTFKVTEDRARDLTPGRRYHWKVLAIAADGKAIGHGEGRFDL